MITKMDGVEVRWPNEEVSLLPLPEELAHRGGAITAFDLDGDGAHDLITAQRFWSYGAPTVRLPVAVAWGKADGSFEAWVTVGETLEASVLLARPLVTSQGFGLLESPNSSSAGPGPRVWHFDGRTPTFEPLEGLQGLGEVLGAGDFDGDGNVDVVQDMGTATTSGTNWTVSWGQSDGTFLPGESVPSDMTSSPVLRAEIGDLDGDGTDEVIVSRNEEMWGLASFTWNEESRAFEAYPAQVLGYSVYDFNVVDADLDGRADIFYGGVQNPTQPSEETRFELGWLSSARDHERVVYGIDAVHHLGLLRAGDASFELLMGNGPAKVTVARSEACGM